VDTVPEMITVDTVPEMISYLPKQNRSLFFCAHIDDPR
jgi:hypothetical protein